MTWRKEPDVGGKVNMMAILKVSSLVVFILVSGHMSHFTPLPDYPQAWLAKQWTVDVLEFANNSTIWEELSSMSKSLYYVIPIFYITLFIGWFVFIRGIHRKKLYINGVKFGTVMWIHGFRHGHIYDMGCLLFNRGRHYKDMADFPRPISGDFMKENMIIYYRPFWFHHPIEWFRMIVDESIIYFYGVQVITPQIDDRPLNAYANRVTDPLRPMIVYSDLRIKSTLIMEEMDLVALSKTHVKTQETMIMNTWRMGRAEPNTALSILSKASYSIPDRTLGKFWEKLPEKEQERIREEWKRD